MYDIDMHRHMIYTYNYIFVVDRNIKMQEKYILIGTKKTFLITYLIIIKLTLENWKLTLKI